MTLVHGGWQQKKIPQLNSRLKHGHHLAVDYLKFQEFSLTTPVYNMFIYTDTATDDKKFFSKTQQPPIKSAKYQEVFQILVAITCERKEKRKDIKSFEKGWGGEWGSEGALVPY